MLIDDLQQKMMLLCTQCFPFGTILNVTWSRLYSHNDKDNKRFEFNDRFKNRFKSRDKSLEKKIGVCRKYDNSGHVKRDCLVKIIGDNPTLSNVAQNFDDKEYDLIEDGLCCQFYIICNHLQPLLMYGFKIMLILITYVTLKSSFILFLNIKRFGSYEKWSIL